MDPFIDLIFHEDFASSPLTVVDGGASGGTNPRWAPFDRYLRVIGFEPDRRAFEILQAAPRGQAEVRYINHALNNTPSEVTFHMTSMQQCSSMFRPNASWLRRFRDEHQADYEVVETTTAEATTLDIALKEAGIADVDFVELDTQGSELLILQGATETLASSVFGVEVEVEFIELYEGQPLFADVDQFLRPLGFELFDLTGAYWKRRVGERVGGRKGQIVFGDALYLSSTEKLFSLGPGHPVSKPKVLKAIAVCVAYGYYDFALEVANEGRQRGVLNEREHRIVAKTLGTPRHLSNLIPRFRGRGRIARAASKVYDIFRIDSWKQPSAPLGNERKHLFRA